MSTLSITREIPTSTKKYDVRRVIISPPNNSKSVARINFKVGDTGAFNIDSEDWTDLEALLIRIANKNSSFKEVKTKELVTKDTKEL